MTLLLPWSHREKAYIDHLCLLGLAGNSVPISGGRLSIRPFQMLTSRLPHDDEDRENQEQFFLPTFRRPNIRARTGPRIPA